MDVEGHLTASQITDPITALHGEQYAQIAIHPITLVCKQQQKQKATDDQVGTIIAHVH